MQYPQVGKVFLLLSVLSVIIAAFDFWNDSALFGLGADSWMLVGIAFAVYANSLKQWKSS
jgi:hypothetical protein